MISRRAFLQIVVAGAAGTRLAGVVAAPATHTREWSLGMVELGEAVAAGDWVSAAHDFGTNFSHVAVRWRGEGALPDFRARGSSDGVQWGAWQELPVSAHARPI